MSDVWGDEVARLTRERDEARAELRDVEVALDHLVRQALGLNRLDTAGTALKCIDAVTDERNRLRALLREVEWVFIRGDAQMCPVCTGTRRYGRRVQEDEGHRIDCRLKAALEEESHD